MNIKQKAENLKSKISVIFLALKHKDTPWYAKAMAAITVAYALSPIDLIPDFIPILGYIDDIVLLPFFIALTIKLLPNKIVSECEQKPRIYGVMANQKNGILQFLFLFFGL